MSSCCGEAQVTQQASEGYRGRQRRKVDEDDGGEALHVHGILQVTDVVRVAAADVVDQASERDPRARQRIHLLVSLSLLLRAHL